MKFIVCVFLLLTSSLIWASTSACIFIIEEAAQKPVSAGLEEASLHELIFYLAQLKPAEPLGELPVLANLDIARDFFMVGLDERAEKPEVAQRHTRDAIQTLVQLISNPVRNLVDPQESWFTQLGLGAEVVGRKVFILKSQSFISLYLERLRTALGIENKYNVENTLLQAAVGITLWPVGVYLGGKYLIDSNLRDHLDFSRFSEDVIQVMAKDQQNGAQLVFKIHYPHTTYILIYFWYHTERESYPVLISYWERGQPLPPQPTLLE